MRIGLATVLLLSLTVSYVSSIKQFDEVDPVEQEIVRNAIKNHWMDLKNYKLKGPKKTNFTGNIMKDIMTMRFRPPHPNATKMAMAHVLQERILKEAEFALREARGMNTTDRRRRQLPPGSLTPSSVADILQAIECDEFLPLPNCDRESLFVRTIDGTCNNLIFQTHGATFDIFSRLLPPLYEDGISEPRGFLQPNPFEPPLPSARTVSRVIHQNKDQARRLANVDEDVLTHLVMQWGQFIDHDITYLIEGGEGNEFLDVECFESGTPTESEFCANIPVDTDDRLFNFLQTNFQRDTLPFERSAPSCFVPLISGGPRAREIINQLTSFNDASMIYGATEEEERNLRLFSGGLLLEAADQLRSVTAGLTNIPPGTLPISPGPTTPNCLNGLNCFMAGDRRVSEQFSLSVMHTVFLREHNRIAKELAQLNPSWSDEAIYQVARRIVIAEVQNIVYSEYLPVILGANNVQEILGPYTGYDVSADPRSSNEFATAAYRFGHSQIRDRFTRIDQNGNLLEDLTLVDAFFNSKLFFDPITGGTDPIVRGLVQSQSRRVDEFISFFLTNRLFSSLLDEDPDELPPLDLAARNIQRGRDHGLPTYLQARRFCKELFDISSEFSSDQVARRLQSLYGQNLDFVDLFPGGLAEARLPGSLLGATFTCIIGLTFKNIRNGDRFFYQNEGVFDSDQLQALERITIASVLCENTGIGSIQREAFKTGGPISCANIPSLDLRLFKRDSIGEMIQNNDFSHGSYPGEEQSVGGLLRSNAFLIQKQVIPSSINELSRLIGADDNGIVSWLKVEILNGNGDVFGESRRQDSYKINRGLTEFGAGLTSGPAAVCIKILTSFDNMETSVFIYVSAISTSCVLNGLATGLNNDLIDLGSFVGFTVPITANEEDGVYDTEFECRLGRSNFITSGIVEMNPSEGVGVRFTC